MNRSSELRRVHYLIFMSFALGFLIWGFVSTSGIMTIDYFKDYIPKWLLPVSVVLGYIFVMLGDTVMGFLTDRVGRKRIFIYTMSLYTIGLLGMAASLYVKQVINPLIAFIILMVSYALAEFGVGGEEPPALAAISELMPSGSRGMMLVLTPNFDNIGAALAAAVLYAALVYTGSASVSSIYAMIGSALVVVFLTILVRLRIPESVRWLESRGRVNEAVEIAKREGLEYALSSGNSVVQFKAPPAWYRALFLSIIGFTQITTYGLMAYTIIYLPSLPFSNNYNLQALVILLANLGASIAGLVGLIMDKVGRRPFTLFAYLGGLVTMVPIFLIYAASNTPLKASLPVFYTLLFLNMVFSEFEWAVRTVLEPELFPTRVRGTWIGVIRLIAWGIYVVLTYYLLNILSTYQYLLTNLILYAIGAAAAVTWFIYGIETKGIPISTLDNIMSKQS
ncbi:MFS transporter [Caldivirga maquilingensis]|uniref:Major facilitator superfamily MFS_1 n=1 Tax=Caldivirga maquilingensis (strain ATCC 700844 / DSM 13496 / JCM 10307 / IC-167) TaxID=397948 RepID=A8ME20_CALMQ|nr:MFS transporter [Caldivirga maquilingensis]ABW02026.1 major facilitator superfamily MFS_1 [Caldivirga maquilingensis IC-167]